MNSNKDIFKTIVPTSFDINDQTYYGHLNKREINNFCDKLDVLKPHNSCFQAFVSTGRDLNDGCLKVSLTALSFFGNPSVNMIKVIDEDDVAKIKNIFKNQ